ncbi:MAG: GGDEF domain-containing protein [Chloroflexi bacterium]|nr:GGDEF domain-containing protein [Chloroflexota bacterium]
MLELLANHAAIAIENSRLFATIQRLANTDPLTGVLTRRKFFDMAEHEFQRAKRYKTPMSILMLDVDEFKQFNDRFGHQAGDLVLETGRFTLHGIPAQRGCIRQAGRRGICRCSARYQP